MRPHRTLYKTLDHSIVLNERTFPVKVTISTEPDLDGDAFDQHFETEEQREELREKLQNGQLELVGVIVRAELCGEAGQDSIWSCLVGTDYTPEQVVEDNDMIANALHELTENLKTQYSALREIFGE